MAGISAETCISLILERIGGIPLLPTILTSVEGSPVTKQLGMAGFSMPGLDMLSGALDGIDPSNMLGDVFQNTVGSISDQLGSIATATQDALESAFVSVSSITDPITGAVSEIREVGGELAGKLSLEQLDNLKANLAELSSSLPEYKDLTDKISGVKFPNYNNAGEFGFQQVMAVQSSYENLANNIPDELNKQTTDLKGAISDNLSKITKPLEINSHLEDAHELVNSAVSQLQAAATYGTAAVQSKYNEIMAGVSSASSLVSGTVADSKTTMNSFVNGSKAIGMVESISGGLVNGSMLNNSLVNSVVKGDVLGSIAAGIDKFAPSLSMGGIRAISLGGTASAISDGVKGEIGKAATTAINQAKSAASSVV